MVELRCVVSDAKTGKTYNKTLTENSFIGKKIGHNIQGDSLGLTGYELQITGGSDNAGFPMKKNLEGMGRKKPLLKAGVGFHKRKRKPQHTQKHYFLAKRKTIVGNTIGQHISQINFKIIKYGSKTIEELLGIKKEEAQEEKKAS